MPPHKLPQIFSQKICRTCGEKFRPTGSGREVNCQDCKAKAVATKKSKRAVMTRSKTLARRICKECNKRFRPYHSRDEFCCVEHRETYWQRYRLARSRADRERLAVAEERLVRQVAEELPVTAEVKSVSELWAPIAGDLGRKIQGGEFFRLKRLYELREAGEFKGHVV